MARTLLFVLLPLLALFSSGSDRFLTGSLDKGRDGSTGVLEKMIVSNGTAAMDLNLNQMGVKGLKSTTLNFDVQKDSFFTVLVFNDELRGPIPGTMTLIPKSSAALPAKLSASMDNLVIESTPIGSDYELAVRDGKTGFLFFNIEGHTYDYDPSSKALNIAGGKVLLSKEFAAELGHSSDSGKIVGSISVKADMRDIDVSQVFNGEVTAETMPAVPEAGSVPGPDVIVGDLNGLAQFDGSAGGQVGLAVGTDSCNLGTVDLDWFQTPINDHPVIPQNMYRMSGGATNDQTFEQIGQSNVKHAFTALTENICSLGCNGTGGTHLGSGCSDPYVASLNSGQSNHSLGSRAWINPFTGAYPRGDSATPPNVHTGHTHTGPAHRILVNIGDLDTTQNAGATYYAEAMYVTPHEYVWCQSHPGQCNMYNNVSYRRYNVTGTTSFSFPTGGFTTQRMKAAITAWTGATFVQMEPEPGIDGIGTVGYKVTNPSAGVWHYEYVVYNQNMDRGIQSFSVPTGNGVTVSNIGFHAPPQQPGWAGDGTLGNTGFSNTPWTGAQAGGALTWASETLAQNANANAIRWGTMYNFRFDSNRPPQAMNATVGFYKTGAPITVGIQGPSPVVVTGPFQVSGRLFTASNIPVRSASVIINDGAGHIFFTVTSSLGYYVFDNVPAGGPYTISVSSKRYTFDPVNVMVNNNLADQNLTALPDPEGRQR
jgi:Carboxypeptidase regulatory-like domain